MDATNKESNIIDENQSLTVIKEMIAVSRIKLRQDGIFVYCLGWVLFLCVIQRVYHPGVFADFTK